MNTFANIDANRIASYKQFQGVISMFTACLAKKKRISKTKNPKGFRILRARVTAATAAHFGEAKMTHGDVQKFFKLQVIPREIEQLVKDTKDLKQ
tara:strand:- start:275 stop:559 length:285 start_codon:yes stop_codon:yes gene_type:complete